MPRNFFKSLSRYANRQQENFLTESFAYFLEVLMSREPDLFKALVRLLAGDALRVDSDQLLIRTQEPTKVGTPDLVLEQLKEVLVYIEIKHDSSLGDQQLEKYLGELKESKHTHKELVLLTRSKHSIKETSLPKTSFRHICWYEIAGTISDYRFEDPVVSFLAHDFLDFLEEKGMSIQRIGWEYIRGVPALRYLTSMLNTALSEALPEVNVTKNAGWHWIGYLFGNAKNWIGIRMDDPIVLLLEKGEGQAPKASKKTDLEKAHFFSMEAGEQLEYLIAFIKEGVDDLSITFPEIDAQENIS